MEVCKTCSWSESICDKSDDKIKKCVERHKKERKIRIYRKRIPDHYTHAFGITISSKDDERNGLEYDLMCVLIDAIDNHPQFKNVKIIDERN